ncbi:MAG: tRNA pseudouridine(55) synthase TruB [Lachnospiraceae bacterium]|nr:tRNA pseudouridine(55) synthase TruB [Lachnospiraceae bacterium]
MDGIINVYKERGFTSHDVVAKLRGILRMKKIGHTGTLDPDACGVLPVCLGHATKVCELLTDKRKTYEAVLLLGRETDTQDVSGQTLQEKEVNVIEEQVRQVIAGFLGDQMQVPPMYSALKVDGKKLYELAREGKVIERKARPVTFYELEILSMELPRVRIRVTCSKGTYIRTLCHDIGQELGCGGCMEELLRTYVEPFALETSLTLAQIQQLADEGRVEEILCPVEQLFADMPACVIRSEFCKYMYNGNPLKTSWVELRTGSEGSMPVPEIRLYTEQNVFFGIYEYQQDRRQYKLKKMFYGG